MASRRVFRTMILPYSARHFSRISQPSTYAFSPFQAPRHYSVANPAVTASTQQHGAGIIGSATKFPRPETIPWQEELSNKVHLIGLIDKLVQLKCTETGNAFACTRLGTNFLRAQETTWFSLKFLDEMAEIAAKHVKTGDVVYVSGSMNVLGSMNSEEIEVVVSKLNFVEHRSFSPQMDVNINPSISASQKEGIHMQHANSGNKILETEKSWLAFFNNPTEWWDNRKDKRNPRAPDFKHKSTGGALWIESYSNPPWVKSKLDELDERMNVSHESVKTKKSSSSFDDKEFDFF